MLSYAFFHHCQGGSCQLPSAAERSFLYSTVVDKDSLRDLNTKTGMERPSLLHCPSYKLVDALVAAFDENEDKALTGSEKAVMLATLLAAPDVAANRVIAKQGIRFSRVNFYGACGRVTLSEGDLKPLSSFLDQSLEVRKGLGKKIKRQWPMEFTRYLSFQHRNCSRSWK